MTASNTPVARFLAALSAVAFSITLLVGTFAVPAAEMSGVIA